VFTMSVLCRYLTSACSLTGARSPAPAGRRSPASGQGTFIGVPFEPAPAADAQALASIPVAMTCRNISTRIGAVTLLLLALGLGHRLDAQELELRPFGPLAVRCSTVASIVYDPTSHVDSLRPDVMPVLLEPIPLLEFPPGLEAGGIGGSTKLAFVVDSSGKVLPASVRILDATASAFVPPAMRWLVMSRFTPGSKDACPVAVRVLQRLRWRVETRGRSDGG